MEILGLEHLTLQERDGAVLGSLLFVGSFVPARVLRDCTVSSFCMSRLRNLAPEGNVDEACLMWVSPLCSWGQGAEVLDLVMEWLEEALATEQVGCSCAGALNGLDLVVCCLLLWKPENAVFWKLDLYVSSSEEGDSSSVELTSVLPDNGQPSDSECYTL